MHRKITCADNVEPNHMKTSAVISPCNQYRYELRRIWDVSKPLVLFICLNPSTADEVIEDNTSKVCINYAKRWGFGGLLIGNLFAFRSTLPSALHKANNPIGPDNNLWLKKLQLEASLVVCAWSDIGSLNDRDKEVLAFLKEPYCLVKLKSGRPGHPLYKRADLTPIRL